jgi:hypothetical protein
MYSLVRLTATSLTHNSSMDWSLLRRGFLAITLALALVFALALTARAVDPPPDGHYPHQNTAEGLDALLSLTIGQENTAIGFNALKTR